MGTPAQQHNEPVGMTRKQLDDYIASQCKAWGDEALGDKIREEISKSFERQEKQSQDAKLDSMKSALFCDSPDRARKGLVTGKPTDGEFTGLRAAKLIGALVAGRVNQPFVRKRLDEWEAEGKDFGAVRKALEASDFSAGGALLPEEMAADFIGYLYNRSIVRSLGAATVEMPRGGKLNFGKGGQSATAYWGGETEAITVSQQTTRQLSLDAKKLRVLVPISNDLLRQAPPGFESIIRDDMTNVAVVAEDTKFIRGDGSNGTPLGIRGQMSTSNQFDANDTANVANVTADLIKAQYLVRASNVPMERLGWMMPPRTYYYLMTLRTDDGYHVFRDMLMQGELYGEPVGTSQNIPINLDPNSSGTTDKTEIYFGSFAQVVVGDTLSVEVSISDQASYVQSGTTHHGFQEDISLMRLVHESDILLRYDDAFAMIEECDWGNSLA